MNNEIIEEWIHSWSILDNRVVGVGKMLVAYQISSNTYFCLQNKEPKISSGLVYLTPTKDQLLDFFDSILCGDVQLEIHSKLWSQRSRINRLTSPRPRILYQATGIFKKNKC